MTRDRSPWVMLATLWAIFAVQGVDRSVNANILGLIARDFALNDMQVGLLAGLAYAVPYALAGIPIGALGDRMSRTRLIAVLLLIWSLATGSAALASGYIALLCVRATVGASEAGQPPTMLSILGDSFEDRTRPLALSLFYTAPFAGALAGALVGGLIAQDHGWRLAVLISLLPGLVLALVVGLLRRDPPRGATSAGMDPADIAAPLAILPGLRLAARGPSWLRIVVALVLGNFATIAIASFLPLFLLRVHQLAPAQVGLASGLTTGLIGGIGVLAGGIAANRFARGDQRRLQRFCGGTLLAASLPLLIGALASNTAVAIALYAVWALVGGAYIGAGWDLAIATCPPHVRGTALAAAMVIANFAGAGLGPQFVGALSEALRSLGPAPALSYAMAAVTPVAVISGLLFLIGSIWPAQPRQQMSAL